MSPRPETCTDNRQCVLSLLADLHEKLSENEKVSGGCGIKTEAGDESSI